MTTVEELNKLRERLYASLETAYKIKCLSSKLFGGEAKADRAGGMIEALQFAIKLTDQAIDRLNKRKQTPP